MLVRIFAFQDVGIDRYLNFLRLEMGNGSAWQIEHCDPIKWSPSPGDIHIYIDVPVRIAVPFAKFNIFTTNMEVPMWAWTKTEMDLILTTTAIVDRKSAIPTLRRAMKAAIKFSHPPALPTGNVAEKPKVGIITLTRNRKKWWGNMVHNVVTQSWPLNRLEWIIVDDGDDGERLGDEVETFMEKKPGFVIRYTESPKRLTIGAKRNAAVKAASEDTTVFVCMDDDDHYPKDSIGARVAWLKDSKTKVAYCSTIPMYDLTRYISAMNVPELELGPAERISEATLAFTRDAWNDRPFPDVNMAEGIGFLEGREEISVEIPSKGVIVSFIHSANSSSRRIPAEQEPNGCHYGFADEFFKYLHSIC